MSDSPVGTCLKQLSLSPPRSRDESVSPWRGSEFAIPLHRPSSPKSSGLSGAYNSFVGTCSRELSPSPRRFARTCRPSSSIVGSEGDRNRETSSSEVRDISSLRSVHSRLISTEPGDLSRDSIPRLCCVTLVLLTLTVHCRRYKMISCR